MRGRPETASASARGCPSGESKTALAPGTHGMSVPSCALERARRASVHTRILPFFVSASSCPVTVIVGQWGRAAVTGMTRSGSVSGSASSVSSGQAPVEAKGVAILPNQFREHGSAPQARPQAVGEGPYVSAGTANDSEGNVRKLNPEDFRTRNFDGLDFERGFFPLPGQLVEGLTLMLGR